MLKISLRKVIRVVMSDKELAAQKAALAAQSQGDPRSLAVIQNELFWNGVHAERHQLGVEAVREVTGQRFRAER